MIHISNEFLGSVPMPTGFSLHTDNATGEGKNQVVAKYLAWLTYKGLFKYTELSQHGVGHTHGQQDQRFSEACTALKKTDQLQDPDDFIDVFAETGNSNTGPEAGGRAYPWRSGLAQLLQ